ncbi:hypothetical protein O181_096904 [Austropuccinia psidii MF-1]|uniref:Uncharacterized protein n=1 Tax=Austropuccinia psidii MF-1 TaxID=1389203 RepID=A0A9Q3J7X6_9BASI|nr:hypothetical protein [Austropuccinia psidii MF-1]
MQAGEVLHLPNLNSQHCSTQYTFVKVCCRAEQKLFNNVTCNHVQPLSHICELHPSDAPSWRALPNYGTDWIHSCAIVGQTLTGRACSSRVPVGGQEHAFIRTPQSVIHRQPSHDWETFYFQSSDWLLSWSGGQLDCRRSPARAWKPEANQCGFASASSALE